MPSFTTVPELAEMTNLPAFAVRRRLDLLGDDMVVMVGRQRVVPGDKAEEVIRLLKALPYSPRGRTTISEALAAGR